MLSQKSCEEFYAKKDSKDPLKVGRLNVESARGDSIFNLGGTNDSSGSKFAYVRSSKRTQIHNVGTKTTILLPQKSGTIALLSDIPKMGVDSNGFFKKASPIIKIYANGNFETSDESEGAIVQRLETGKYTICGVLGYNADGAWGVNGGVTVTKNSNGLELIYIKDKVLSDGSIEIKTFHRQQTHLPKDFQNWRIKEIIDENPVHHVDGEPCDIPPSTWVDVRVEMPDDSICNQQQAQKE
uniref:Phage tail protein C-terminal domain-containing protein n=1 Tax=Arsenophonus endosymbiont of Trialeurodes vaporariorum TaxID=235567 RepID=A0A3B0MGE6_9GAMM